MADNVHVSHEAAGPASEQSGVERPHQFGLTAAMALIVGSIIGVGIFNLPTYLGVETAAVAAAKVRNPDRNIPRATILGTIATAVVYMLSLTAVFGIVPTAELATAAHFRVRAETCARTPILVLAIAAAGAVFLTFVFTTLIHEPASAVTLIAILVLSAALDFGWKHFHAGRTRHVQPEH